MFYYPDEAESRQYTCKSSLLDHMYVDTLMSCKLKQEKKTLIN